MAEPDFERNLASMHACEPDGMGGYHAVLYRSVGRTFLEPKWVDLGEELPRFNTPTQVRAIMDEAKVATCSAIDFLRMCQAAQHDNGEHTKSYSSRLELAGSVVLASGGELLPVAPGDLQVSRFPYTYHTTRLLSIGEGRYVAPNSLIQDRRRTAQHRAANKLAGIILADMSTPTNEVYVGLWNETTRFVPLPK